jgi:thiamine-phosphate pyrophosphorylase
VVVPHYRSIYEFIFEAKKVKAKHMKRNEIIEILSSGIYCITDEQHSQGRSNADVVKQMLDGGAKIIQYREKEKTGLEKYRDCLILRKYTSEYRAVFIVNDDIHIAMAVEADGVHIGQDDMPIEAVRSLLGCEKIIGLSTHSPEQALDAGKRGADYIGAGPIFQTFTKKNVCDPVGLEYLMFAVESVNIPVVAIGGIKESNIDQVIACGAKTVCLVTGVTEAMDITRTVSEIGEKIRNGCMVL